MTREPEGLISTVPASPRASGPEWLVGLRRDAAARLREDGFPGKKHEKWRFTSVRGLVGTTFEAARAGALDEALRWVDERLGEDGAARVVLVDGRPVIDRRAILAGVRIESLASALAERPSLLEPVLGKLAPREHFAALNAAMFEDGVLVHVEDGATLERPIHLVHLARGGTAAIAAYPRVVVIAGAGSDAVLVETFLADDALARSDSAAHLTNGVSEIAVHAGARLDHTRLLFGADRTHDLAYVAVRLEAGSHYASRVVTLGGALSRLDLDVHLSGEGASCVLDGAYHVDREEHVDHHIVVDHEAPRGTSSTCYRGLLDGKGHAVFDAIGAVRKNARGSSVAQENRNLLLSDDATIDTKPHLEIETDEVRASHGSTIGAIDDAQLFYLRSRGISEAEARDVLTFAFVRAVVERIPHEPTARRASEALLARLPSGARIRELSA